MAELVSVTLNGTTPSAEIDLRLKTITRIYVPSGWDTADLNFLEAYETGGTFSELFDENGDEVAIAAAASRMITVDPRRFQSSRWLKVVSSNSQQADRVLRVQVTRLSDLVYTGGGLAGVAL